MLARALDEVASLRTCAATIPNSVIVEGHLGG